MRLESGFQGLKGKFHAWRGLGELILGLKEQISGLRGLIQGPAISPTAYQDLFRFFFKNMKKVTAI